METSGFDMAARHACMDMCKERFGSDAALVSVPKLARVLGFARSTLYARIKAGNFFIAHRMIGDAPMVTLDALVDWYLFCSPVSGAPTACASNPAVGPEDVEARSRREREEEANAALIARRRRLNDRRVDDWVARAMEAVGKEAKGPKAERGSAGGGKRI